MCLPVSTWGADNVGSISWVIDRAVWAASPRTPGLRGAGLLVPREGDTPELAVTSAFAFPDPLRLCPRPTGAWVPILTTSAMY